MKSTARNGKVELFTTVSNDAYVELTNMTGQRIHGFTVWDEAFVDAIAAGAANKGDIDRNGAGHSGADSNARDVVDVDIYLEGGIYFELYGTLCYPTLDSEPLKGMTTIRNVFADLINSGLWLDEIAVDEEEQLILVLSQKRKPMLYLSVGGWLLDEWDELPT